MQNIAQGVSVKVSDLRKSFVGKTVLNGVSFSVEPGEIFAIMGPSGSGKTVLIKHIIGLERPDSGEIRINNEPVGSADLFERHRVAMVFQSGALLNSLTVGENVGLYLSEHRLKKPDEIARIVSDKLALVGLKGIEDRNPAELSGGMKKRVAIARALVVDPQLVLYDEPTSELDPLMGVTIGQEIVNLREKLGATSILVTHDRDLAFGVADRIGMINEGQFIFIGTPDEVRNHPDQFIQKFIHAELNIYKRQEMV